MPYQHKNNRGTLWPNEYKREGDRQPDWRGQQNVNGVIWDVVAWRGNIGGKDVINLLTSDSADRPQRQASQQQNNGSRVQQQLVNDDSSIPF